MATPSRSSITGRLVARNSSFTYKGKAVDVKRVGRELGVRYVLEGSVSARADWALLAFTISSWIARGGQTNSKLMIEGLQKAGLPE